MSIVWVYYYFFKSNPTAIPCWIDPDCPWPHTNRVGKRRKTANLDYCPCTYPVHVSNTQLPQWLPSTSYVALALLGFGSRAWAVILRSSLGLLPRALESPGLSLSVPQAVKVRQEPSEPSPFQSWHLIFECSFT